MIVFINDPTNYANYRLLGWRELDIKASYNKVKNQEAVRCTSLRVFRAETSQQGT